MSERPDPCSPPLARSSAASRWTTQARACWTRRTVVLRTRRAGRPTRLHLSADGGRAARVRRPDHQHHFQYEGDEVIPDGIELISTWIAARPHVRVPDHVQRRAAVEPVAPGRGLLRRSAYLSGWRAMLGVGRDDVPRGVSHLNHKGVSTGSTTIPTGRRRPAATVRCFEESMEIVRRALLRSRSRSSGEYFQIPSPASRPWRAVQELTLAPKPIASVRDLAGGHHAADPRLRAVVDHGAVVFWNQHDASSSGSGTPTARSTRPRTGRTRPAREADVGLCYVRIEDTTEEARARPFPATTSSGSSSARTDGAVGTGRTASRRGPA